MTALVARQYLESKLFLLLANVVLNVPKISTRMLDAKYVQIIMI